MPTYNLDPTGIALQNNVIGETKTLNLPASRNFLFVVPTYGPIFDTDVIIQYTNLSSVSRILQVGVDYYLGFKFLDATTKSNKPIYGAIVLIDNTLTGTITYNYHSLGGAFVLSGGAISTIQANEARNPSVTTWEQVASPSTFPTVAYPWSAVNVPDITKAVDELGKAGLVVHLRPKFLSNPSNIVFVPSKAEIGLGSVANYPPASSADALAGTSDVVYMTPLKTATYVGPAVTAALNSIGYGVPVVYAAGLVMDAVTKSVLYSGQVYAPIASQIPFTTSGTFETAKFSLASTSTKDTWDKSGFTITGGESVSDEYKTFTITVTHNSRVTPQLFLNDVIFLVYKVDYQISGNTLLVNYPLATGDSLNLYTKKPVTSSAADKSIYQKITVTSGVNTFTLNDNTVSASNLRVTLNDIFVLDNSLDYSISASYILTVNIALEIGDVLEIENIDNMPFIGKAKLREILA
jgi:hypothetical protein